VHRHESLSANLLNSQIRVCTTQYDLAYGEREGAQRKDYQVNLNRFGDSLTYGNGVEGWLDYPLTARLISRSVVNAGIPLIRQNSHLVWYYSLIGHD